MLGKEWKRVFVLKKLTILPRRKIFKSNKVKAVKYRRNALERKLLVLLWAQTAFRELGACEQAPGDK